MERQLANLTGMVHKALNVPRVPRAHSDLESGYRSDRELYPSRGSGESGRAPVQGNSGTEQGYREQRYWRTGIQGTAYRRTGVQGTVVGRYNGAAVQWYL